MNKYQIYCLKGLRKAYQKFLAPVPATYDRDITEPDEASEAIYHLLASGKPCMIARYGSNELAALTNYLEVNATHHSVWKYIKGDCREWWWNVAIRKQMQSNAGFFPSTEENLQRFGELMMADSRDVDLLGSWLRDELVVLSHLHITVKRCSLLLLEPYWSGNPWSRVLEGRKVLVIHPFASLIEKQYRERREKLFSDTRVLPLFELKTIQAVQSLGGVCEEYKDWFEALDAMKATMNRTDYDIALVGCGAYGFPLAAHAKRMGKQAVHLGGALQLLFGIKGKRWENPEYGARVFRKQNMYNNLFNEWWIRPSDSFKPVSADNVEGACYW